MQNWAKSVTFNSSRLHEPTTSNELSNLVSSSPELKAIGSTHSFSRIADTHGEHLSLLRLGSAMELDRSAQTVTVAPAVRYGELGEFLWQQGYALRNLASLPHISVVGACATATHGSGDANGNLSTAVEAMQVVAGDGSIRSLSRAEHGEAFNGMVVHLGALGVVTRVTLKVVPAFRITQRVYERLAFDAVERDLEAVTQTAYSVSLFTTWREKTFDQVWLKELADGTRQRYIAPDFYGAKPATVNLHPIRELPAEPCTEQLGVPGPWHDRLPHFRLSHTPSAGAEIQTEYFVAREVAVEALRRLFDLSERIAPVLQISEIRTVAEDDLWLSPCYRQPRVGIHFTWKQDPSAVGELLPVIEKALADLEPVPHWAKVFTMDRDLVRSRYPRLGDFQQLVRDFDLRGVFRNQFLKDYVL